MKDIVERLRDDPWHAWMEEAADEIERLRALLREASRHVSGNLDLEHRIDMAINPVTTSKMR